MLPGCSDWCCGVIYEMAKIHDRDLEHPLLETGGGH
jgi:hypothetical protein